MVFLKVIKVNNSDETKKSIDIELDQNVRWEKREMGKSWKEGNRKKFLIDKVKTIKCMFDIDEINLSINIILTTILPTRR